MLESAIEKKADGLTFFSNKEKLKAIYAPLRLSYCITASK